ncbi:MAG: hypothetical protein AAGB51_06740 [Planctomycetota bacterium]
MSAADHAFLLAATDFVLDEPKQATDSLKRATYLEGHSPRVAALTDILPSETKAQYAGRVAAAMAHSAEYEAIEEIKAETAAEVSADVLPDFDSIDFARLGLQLDKMTQQVTRFNDKLLNTPVRPQRTVADE